MNQERALQIINRATQVSNDRQIRGLNPHLQANLAEHFAHLSKYIDFMQYDIDDVLRTLLYCDEQRQKGMRQFGMNRGRLGAMNTPQLEAHISNVRRIGNGTSLAGTDDLDMIAQYAQFQYDLGTQGPRKGEDSFVPEPEEIKRLKAIGAMPQAPRLTRTGQEPERIQGGTTINEPEPAKTRKKSKIGDKAEDITTESKRIMKYAYRLSESQLSKVILESALNLIRESMSPEECAEEERFQESIIFRPEIGLSVFIDARTGRYDFEIRDGFSGLEKKPFESFDIEDYGITCYVEGECAVTEDAVYISDLRIAGGCDYVEDTEYLVRQKYGMSVEEFCDNILYDHEDDIIDEVNQYYDHRLIDYSDIY